MANSGCLGLPTLQLLLSSLLEVQVAPVGAGGRAHGQVHQAVVVPLSPGWRRHRWQHTASIRRNISTSAAPARCSCHMQWVMQQWCGW